MGTDKHILFGFGGSGCDALCEFAKWVAQDYKVSLQARDDFAFVLCDTSEDELTDKIATLKGHLSGVMSDPLVDSIALAAPFGDNLFSEEARSLLARAGKDPHERVISGWWHKAPEGGGSHLPFIAPSLQASVRTGAGQCPAVSAFCAWALACENQIEPLVQRIMEKLEHRAGAYAQQMKISTYLVAGLSGGTGRGSWAPIGLEIATALRRQGKAVTTQGFFVDASAFEKEVGLDQFVKQRVNSLTGVSEISAWLRNAQASRQPTEQNPMLHFELPSFDRPKDAESDAISTRHALVKLGGNDTGIASPIDQAFVFGARSRSGVVAMDKSRVFSMIGSAIFARICQPIIAADEINKGYKRLGSIGVAQYYVPATEIREHLGKLVKCRMPGEALGTPITAEMCTKSISEIREKLAPKLAAADDNPLLKVMKDGLLTALRPAIQEFVRKLEAQSPKEAIEAAGRLREKITRDVTQAVVNQAISQAFADGGATPEESVRRLLVSKIQHLGLRDVHAILDAIGSILAGHTDLSKRLAASGGTDLVAKVKEYAASTSLPFGFGEAFSPSERKTLQSAAELHVLNHAFAGLRSAFEARMATLANEVSGWQKTLAQVIAYVETETSHDTQKLEKVEGGLFIREPHFAATDPATRALLEGEWIVSQAKKLLEETPGERLITRRLRPILSSEKIARLQSETRRQGGTTEELVRKIVDLGTRTGLGNAQSAPGQFQPAVQRELDQLMAALRGAVQIDQFKMEQQFSFVEVVGDQLEFWMRCINHERVAGDRRMQDELARAFARQFGLKLEREKDNQGVERDKFIVPELGALLHAMCVDLAASCDPLLQFGSRELKQSVTIFLPRDARHEKEDGVLTKLGTRIKNREDDKLQQATQVRLSGDSSRSHASPFMLLAYTPCWVSLMDAAEAEALNVPKDDLIAGTLDEVQTFQYRTLPDVKMWMEASECKDGRSYFSLDRYGQGTYGFGFTFPMFVRDAAWSAKRWKPWARDVAAEQELEARKFAEAAAWALSSFDPSYLGMLISTGSASSDRKFADGIRERFAALHNEGTGDEYDLGRDLEDIFRDNEALKKGPYLIGPMSTDESRWKINRNILRYAKDSKSGVGRLVEGQDQADIPIETKSFTSLGKFLEFLRQPAGRKAVDALLQERDLFRALLGRRSRNPMFAERFLADCVVKLMMEERNRVKAMRQHPDLIKAVDEVHDAALAWRQRCSAPADA